MNINTTRIATFFLGLAFIAQLCQADKVDKKFLKTLPAEEQSLKDTVDHWGMPFSDQLRRFLAAESLFAKALGEKCPKDFIVGIQHGLEKIPQNKYWFKGKCGTTISLDAARNETESAQLAVMPGIGKKLDRVTLTPGPLRLMGRSDIIPVANVTVYRTSYVKTRSARYPSMYTGMWPDCLLPNGPIQIDGVNLGLFWIDFKIPKTATAGTYTGQLQLEADGQSVPIDVTLTVHTFQLPDRVPFPITVWTAPKWPSGKKMSPEDYRTLLAEFLKHGVDPISVGRDFVSLSDNDFTELDKNLQFCLDRGLQLYEIPGPGKDMKKLGPLVKHLRKKGWFDKAIVYSNRDEPKPEKFISDNVPFCQKMNSEYPDLRVFLASEYRPNIDQGCNIWMTDLSTGQGPDFARRNHGKAELWFYYCHMPIHTNFCRPLVHAPNMEIDNEAIEHRLALWLAWKYDTTGMFIWAGNREWPKTNGEDSNWEEKGWQLPDKPYLFPFAGTHNGNGSLLYPGAHPSIRLKVLRDGLEDYGYLMELQRLAQTTNNVELRKQAEALLAVPKTVLMDSHYFNRNPDSLLKARKEIAQLIDLLGKQRSGK